MVGSDTNKCSHPSLTELSSVPAGRQTVVSTDPTAAERGLADEGGVDEGVHDPEGRGPRTPYSIRGYFVGLMRTRIEVPVCFCTCIFTPAFGTFTPTFGIVAFQYARRSSNTGTASWPRM